MMLRLLKQLPGAFGRYVAYRVRGMLADRTRAVPDVASARAEARATPPGHQQRSVTWSDSAKHRDGLVPTLSELVPWANYQQTTVVPEALKSLPLFQIWSTIGGGTKWPQYFEAYERVFSGIRHQPLRVLEIGVFNGASLQMWRRYFDHPQSVVTGIDIDQKCAAYDDAANAMHVLIGDQSDPSFLDAVVIAHGPFDIIIDDGSHISSHVIFSFNHLFQHGLKQTGIYLVEDLHTSYWVNYRDSTLSFIDVAKQMVDIMHSHYGQVSTLDEYYALLDTKHESIAAPRLTTMIDEIRFFDSIVAISKVARPFVPSAMVTN